MTNRSKTTTATTTNQQHENAERIVAAYKEKQRFTREEYLKYSEKTEAAESYISRLERKVLRAFTSGKPHAIVEELVQHKVDKNLVVVEYTAHITNDYNKLVVRGKPLPVDSENCGWVIPAEILVIPLVEAVYLLESNQITKKELDKYYVYAHE